MLSVLKKHLPWWSKIGVKIVLARLPIDYSVWQGVGLFRHGQMDHAGYAKSIFDSHLARVGITADALQGKKLVEIGPGDSIATAIIAHAYGAESTLIDVGDFAKDIPDNYGDLCCLLAKENLPVPDLSIIESIEELLVACNAQYLTSGLNSWDLIASESVDLIFSQAVLEHIRKHEFPRLQHQCWRVMKPGAVASHRIDLQDHLGGALNNLRFSESLWESDFFVKSGFYTNRIQMNAMLDMFSLAGFQVDLKDIRRWRVLPTLRSKMDSAFADKPEMTLNVSGFDVVLRKQNTCAD